MLNAQAVNTTATRGPSPDYGGNDNEFVYFNSEVPEQSPAGRGFSPSVVTINPPKSTGSNKTGQDSTKPPQKNGGIPPGTDAISNPNYVKPSPPRKTMDETSGFNIIGEPSQISENYSKNYSRNRTVEILPAGVDAISTQPRPKTASKNGMENEIVEVTSVASRGGISSPEPEETTPNGNTVQESRLKSSPATTFAQHVEAVSAGIAKAFGTQGQAEEARPSGKETEKAEQPEKTPEPKKGILETILSWFRW